MSINIYYNYILYKIIKRLIYKKEKTIKNWILEVWIKRFWLNIIL